MALEVYKINEKSSFFKNYSKKINSGFKKNDASTDGSSKSSIKFYEYGEKCHISTDGPNKSNNKNSFKKVMNTTWNDSKVKNVNMKSIVLILLMSQITCGPLCKCC